MSTRLFLSYIECMATIGVYDSGIGGLTTLKILLEKFHGNDFFYLSDNAQHPFGTKSKNELDAIVSNGIARLKNHSDFIVLACNTASTVCAETDVNKLLPVIPEKNNVSTDDCLLLATRFTVENTKIPYTKVADTSELASLIEVQASINSKRGNLDMSAILPYLANRLFKFKGVKNVVLGCSHYPYCKKEISKILGDVRYFDGNDVLIKQLEKQVVPQNGQSEIHFEFTGGNEEKKYRKILSILQNTP